MPGRAFSVIRSAGREFGELFGRSYEDPLYRYRAEDADFVFVAMGSLASHATEVADFLRQEGVKAGVIGVRVYRPFPASELLGALQGVRAVAVVEKAISYGYEGALTTELKAAFYGENGRSPVLSSYIAGLGGKISLPRTCLTPPARASKLRKAAKRRASRYGSAAGFKSCPANDWQKRVINTKREILRYACSHSHSRLP